MNKTKIKVTKNFGLRLFGKPTKLLHVENVKNYVDFSYSLSRED